MDTLTAELSKHPIRLTDELGNELPVDAELSETLKTVADWLRR